MNEIASKRRLDRTTQAAEGLPRWRWTTAELERLAQLGAFTSEDRFELIGGEIVPMSPRGRLHEVVRQDLENQLRGRAPADINVIAEAQFNLAEDTYTFPDVLVHPAMVKAFDVSAEQALLVIEIADTSFAYDQDLKARTYARAGVREYWVINARTLDTHVHRAPGDAGYADVVAVPPAAALTPHLVPALAVRLADLDLN